MPKCVVIFAVDPPTDVADHLPGQIDRPGTGHEALQYQRKLTPQSAEELKQLTPQRESIVARPIKFSSLYKALMQNEDGGPSLKAGKDGGRKKVDKTLAKSQPLKILLVDDNKVNILVGSKILGMFGYEVLATAVDGQQAIDAAESQSMDLVLLDLQMPIIGGFEAHERIKASPLAGDPCVVALTANADQVCLLGLPRAVLTLQETQKQCREAGFFDYLSKPLDIPKLEGILRKVFEYRQRHALTEHDRDAADEPRGTAPILKGGNHANDDGLAGERQGERDKAKDRQDEVYKRGERQEQRDIRNEERGQRAQRQQGESMGAAHERDERKEGGSAQSGEDETSTKHGIASPDGSDTHGSQGDKSVGLKKQDQVNGDKRDETHNVHQSDGQ